MNCIPHRLRRTRAYYRDRFEPEGARSPPLLMMMPVMQFWCMRMRVPHRLVHVLVDVGLGSLVAMVAMPVMLVMDMTVGVLQAPVLMRV